MGAVSEEDLVYLYNSASLMVYPSLYEGFGLPILEAMTCGCPVICSNRASMPEVSGEAAVIIEPEDEEGLARRIQELMEDSLLSAKYTKAGIRRAKEFDWNETARKTVRIFDQVRA